MRTACVELLAEMEARLDFAEDLPELNTDSIQSAITALHERLEAALRTAHRGRLLRGGVQARIAHTLRMSAATMSMCVRKHAGGSWLELNCPNTWYSCIRLHRYCMDAACNKGVATKVKEIDERIYKVHHLCAGGAGRATQRRQVEHAQRHLRRRARHRHRHRGHHSRRC